MLESGAFQDDVVSILPKHLVDQRRSGVNLDIFQLILFFEIEELLMQEIDLGKHRLFDFIFVQDHTQLCERRIIIFFPEDIIHFIEGFLIQFAGIANAIMIRIETLHDKMFCLMFHERLIQEVEILLRGRVVWYV